MSSPLQTTGAHSARQTLTCTSQCSQILLAGGHGPDINSRLQQNGCGKSRDEAGTTGDLAGPANHAERQAFDDMWKALTI